MSYQDMLKPWAVVNRDGKPVNRFKSESDADGHCQSLRQQHRGKLFWVQFKPTQKS